MPIFRTGRRKDGSKYRYPITPRKGRRRRKRTISRKILKPLKWVQPFTSIKIGDPLISKALDFVLSQTPIIRELRSAYIVADSIYTHWSLVKELYEEYTLHELEGLVGTVSEEAMRSALSTMQTNIIWGVLRQYIPKSHHNKSLDILSNVVDKITDEEIKYVKNFLQRTR